MRRISATNPDRFIGENFTTEDYKTALQTLANRGKLSSTRLKMLRLQYAATDRTLIEPELTALMGWSGRAGNAHYGTLGKALGANLTDRPATEISEGWSYLSSGVWKPSDSPIWTGDRFHWTMRPVLAQALERLGLIEALPDEQSQPEFGEVPPQTYSEGAVRQVTVNAYERSQAARLACTDYHGTFCQVCDSDLVEFYGPVAQGFIHVHHIRPLSEIGASYIVDPITDLVPVCPNCHAMLHRTDPPLTVDELRELIQEAHQ